jgi:septum formation protein
MALILASASAIRRSMLEQAGIGFTIQAANVDETAEKRNHSDPAELASALAKAKALSVSRDRPSDWVIGSDSLVTVEGRRFDKPGDREQAAEHLRFFSGKEMVLTSAVALAQGGMTEWLHCDSARLKVRPLSERFIEDYLDAEWPEVCYCVGVFRLEGRGIQLFETIDGSYFTVLGMPLLPLLNTLRERELLES